MRINIGSKNIGRNTDPDYLKDYIYDDYHPIKEPYYQSSTRKNGDYKWMFQLLVSGLILVALFGLYRTNLPFANTVKASVRYLLKTETNIQPAVHTILQLASQSGNLDWPMMDDIPKQTKTNQSNEDKNVKPVTTAEPLFILPVSGKVVGTFGWNKPKGEDIAEFNEGIDIQAEDTAEVRSACAGEVQKTGEDDKIGKYIVIKQASGMLMRYSGLSDINVKVGEQAETGDVIGKIKESSKKGTQNKLHFEVIVNGQPINPMEKLGIKEEVDKTGGVVGE